jgi:hypothetical protein
MSCVPVLSRKNGGVTRHQTAAQSSAVRQELGWLVTGLPPFDFQQLQLRLHDNTDFRHVQLSSQTLAGAQPQCAVVLCAQLHLHTAMDLVHHLDQHRMRQGKMRCST